MVLMSIFRSAALILEPDAKVATGLLLTFVALLPAEPLYNAPMIALAVLGLVQLVCRRVSLAAPENRFLCIAFLCIWLPMLASLPDAVNPVESLRKTASVSIYFLAGIYAIASFSRFRELAWVLTGVAAICLFWTLDAHWQYWTGINWFGVPYEEATRLTGVFYTGRIGYVLAGFAPLVFEAVRRLYRHQPWSPVLLVPYFMTIVLSGSRASWIALVVATAGYFVYLFRWRTRLSSAQPRPSLRRMAYLAGATVLAVTLTAYGWPGGAQKVWNTVEPRVETLAGLWSGNREKFERAVSWRFSIWKTATNMWSNNWLNGVGPRGFYYVYREYSPETDFYLLRGGSHGAAKTPHMQLLEIATETGSIGLLGYIVLAAVFLARLRGLGRDRLVIVFPYALTSIVALFPFAGHLGFYGVLAAGMISWTIIVTASAFAISKREEAATPGV